MLNPLGLIFAGGLAALGRWTYLHPDRFLDKFNPLLRPYTNFTLRFTRLAGGLWMSVGVFGLVGFFGFLLLPIVPIPIIVVADVATTILAVRIGLKRSAREGSKT